MIVSVRRFTFALPRLAWKMVKKKVAHSTKPTEEKQGFLESFQTMLEAQNSLAFKNLNDR